mmetsp:Transcript_24482/g.52755  ORF Transcript_24482/g.52755 Transcript_24482/m.52755 type:complete len:305 (+) Transcript_24482:285-1199(+)
MEIVQRIRSSVDLDSSKDSQSTLNTGLAGSDNIRHHNLLRVVKSIRKLAHAVVCPVKTLAEGEDEFLDSTLLKVRELLNSRVDVSTSVRNALEVVRGGDGGTTAVVHEGDARSLNLSNHTILGDTDVRSVDGEAVSPIRNVGGHGTPSSVPGEGESRKSTKVEVISINIYELILKLTRQLISTDRSGQQSVIGSESLLLQQFHDAGSKLLVRNGSGEVGPHELVECRVFGGLGREDLFELFGRNVEAGGRTADRAGLEGLSGGEEEGECGDGEVHGDGVFILYYGHRGNEGNHNQTMRAQASTL